MKLRRAFSLVEALVALAILGLGFVALAHFAAYLRQLNALAPRKAEAAHLLAARAEYLHGALHSSGDTTIEYALPWGHWTLEQQVLDSLDLDSAFTEALLSPTERELLRTRPREIHLEIRDAKGVLLDELYLSILPGL